MPQWDATGPISTIIAWAEKVLYIAVAVLLVTMSAFVIIQSVRDLYRLDLSTSLTADLAIVLNDVLFAIIILELLSTVVAHLRKGGFQVKAFLYIGIISSVRRILVLGAQLSANAKLPARAFRHGILELGVDAGVVLVLAIALLVVRSRGARLPSSPARATREPEPTP
ncbi:MAG: phosphate-starvation-inducible PsiE family protein [Actinomycetota bacterium]|nr:phosphate-starvation-inducible PsiE family protein [Actinomycetota bacterium]